MQLLEYSVLSGDLIEHIGVLSVKIRSHSVGKSIKTVFSVNMDAAGNFTLNV